jgi:hydrogenase maturation protease
VTPPPRTWREAGGGNKAAAVVIGVGNEFRRDDGVGPAVLGRLRGAVPGFVRLVASDGEPASMIEAWAGADLAIVIDALRLPQADGGRQAIAGRTHRIVIEQAADEPVTTVSTHGLGLGDAIGLGRALGRMPGRLIVHAVEVTDCGYGLGLTAGVAGAAETLTAAVLHDLGVGGS